MTSEEQLQRLSATSEEYKEAAERKINELTALVGKLSYEKEAMRHFMCVNLTCKDRANAKVCPNCGEIVL